MLLSFEYSSAQFSCWGLSSYCFVNLILTLQRCHSICSGSITSVLTDNQDRLLALKMCELDRWGLLLATLHGSMFSAPPQCSLIGCLEALDRTNCLVSSADTESAESNASLERGTECENYIIEWLWLDHKGQAVPIPCRELVPTQWIRVPRVPSSLGLVEGSIKTTCHFFSGCSVLSYVWCLVFSAEGSRKHWFITVPSNKSHIVYREFLIQNFLSHQMALYWLVCWHVSVFWLHFLPWLSA